MNTPAPLPHITTPAHWPSPGADSSSRLALELAMAIKPPGEVADQYDIPRKELARRIRTDKQLRHQVAEYRKVWMSPLNAKGRVAVKAATMAEDALVDLWKIMTNPEVNPTVRLDVHRHISKLGEVEPRKDVDLSGPRFSLTLNLGGAPEEQVVIASAENTSREAA